MSSETSLYIRLRLINIILVVFFLFLSGCFNTEYNVGTHKQDFFIYSTEREVILGSNLAKKINKEYKISTNPYDIERINKIANKIVEVIDRKELNYYFYVILEDERGEEQINAFSIPGGHVYVCKGLLNLLDDDDDLAFVLAHEIAHIVSRHHIKRLQAAMGYNFLVIASVGAQADPQFSRGLSFALAQILMGYSQEDELNADELAVKYCKQAGFDPIAGIETLETLHDESKKKIQPFLYFRTHPYLAQRIRNIKETLHLPLGVDDYINF